MVSRRVRTKREQVKAAMASASRMGINSQGRPKQPARTRTAKPMAAPATRIPRAMRAHGLGAGVGDSDRKDEVAEPAAGAKPVGEKKDHEDGRDEAVELVDIAAEIDELLLQAGDDGGVEAEGAGGDEDRVGDVRGLGGWSGSAGGGLVRLLDFAEVFSAELAMHTPGVDAEEEGAEEYEAEEYGDGGEEVALAVADDGGGGESG